MTSELELQLHRLNRDSNAGIRTASQPWKYRKCHDPSHGQQPEPSNCDGQSSIRRDEGDNPELSASVMLQPTFPSLNVGKAVQRAGIAVFPLYVAQLELFDRFDPKPPYAVADFRQRKKVLASNRNVDGSMLPSLTNTKNIPSLFLAGDAITDTSFLNCSMLVPGKRTIRVPPLCYGPARLHAVRGGPIFPSSSAIGWASCGLYEWTLDLFGHRQTCTMAGWQPRLTVCSSLGFTPTRRDVETFVNLVHRLDFRRVKSSTPGCTEWVALDRGVRASALFFEKRLVHLHSIRTL